MTSLWQLKRFEARISLFKSLDCPFALAAAGMNQHFTRYPPVINHNLGWCNCWYSGRTFLIATEIISLKKKIVDNKKKSCLSVPPGEWCFQGFHWNSTSSRDSKWNWNKQNLRESANTTSTHKEALWSYVIITLYMYIPTIPYTYWYRADSRFVPSQWEKSLQSNTVSHCLGANLESALWYTGNDGPELGWGAFKKYLWALKSKSSETFTCE